MRKKRLIALALALALLVGGAAAVCVRKPDWAFVARDWATHLFVRGALQKAEGLTLREVEKAALLEDDRTEENCAMMLVRGDAPLPAAYVPQLDGEGDAAMDAQAREAFEALSDEVERRFGTRLYITSAYRTVQEQQVLAQELPEDIAAGVGGSEHQAGLAADVCVPGYGGSSFLKTEAGQFVNENCWKWGFIIRYPYYGTKETGISFEPWHLRYTGAPHAENIMRGRWTLEEYLGALEEDVFYASGDYVFSRQQGPAFRVPENYEALSISPDNTGFWILTFRLA